MTLIDREAVWKWLSSAPLPVVLAICLSTSGALSVWVWTVAAEVKDQKAVVAVAAEQAAVAKGVTLASDDKLDALLVGMAEMRAELSALKDEVARSRKEKK